MDAEQLVERQQRDGEPDEQHRAVEPRDQESQEQDAVELPEGASRRDAGEGQERHGQMEREVELRVARPKMRLRPPPGGEREGRQQERSRAGECETPARARAPALRSRADRDEEGKAERAREQDAQESGVVSPEADQLQSDSGGDERRQQHEGESNQRLASLSES